jgi:hypothetical protein
VLGNILLSLIKEVNRLNALVGLMASKGILSTNDVNIASFLAEIKEMEAKARTEPNLSLQLQLDEKITEMKHFLEEAVKLGKEAPNA